MTKQPEQAPVPAEDGPRQPSAQIQYFRTVMLWGFGFGLLMATMGIVSGAVRGGVGDALLNGVAWSIIFAAAAAVRTYVFGRFKITIGEEERKPSDGSADKAKRKRSR